MNLRSLIPSDRRSTGTGDQNGHRTMDTGIPPVLALTAETPSSNVSELLEARYSPKVDVYQNRDFYIVRLDIAGMKENELKVGIESGFLTISGRRVPADGLRDLVRSEIIFSEFEQMIHLTEDVFVEGIDATYRYGVLEIKIPRRHAGGVRKVAINSETTSMAAGGGRS